MILPPSVLKWVEGKINSMPSEPIGFIKVCEA